MFAVIKTGGKQYRVAAQDKITVMSLAGAPGERVTFNDVLMLSDEAGTKVGAPFVAGASVAGEIVDHTRGQKVIAFKKRRRKNSKRKRGHRQDLTRVHITEFLLDGVRAGGRTEAPLETPVQAAAEAPVEASVQAAVDAVAAPVPEEAPSGAPVPEEAHSAAPAPEEAPGAAPPGEATTPPPAEPTGEAG